MPDVPNQIQSALAVAVKAKLPPDRAERYRAELDERGRVRKEVTARNLVAKLDQLLNLSPEQRAKIAAALEESADSLASTLDNYITILRITRTSPRTRSSRSSTRGRRRSGTARRR